MVAKTSAHILGDRSGGGDSQDQIQPCLKGYENVPLFPPPIPPFSLFHLLPLFHFKYEAKIERQHLAPTEPGWGRRRLSRPKALPLFFLKFQRPPLPPPWSTSSPGPAFSFLPGVVSLDSVTLAGGLCVPSLDLAYHPRWWGHSRGGVCLRQRQAGRDRRDVSPLWAWRWSRCWVTFPIPGLLPPRPDLFPTLCIFDSLGHRNLHLGHESILRLGPRL